MSTPPRPPFVLWQFRLRTRQGRASRPFRPASRFPKRTERPSETKPKLSCAGKPPHREIPISTPSGVEAPNEPIRPERRSDREDRARPPQSKAPSEPISPSRPPDREGRRTGESRCRSGDTRVSLVVEYQAESRSARAPRRPVDVSRKQRFTNGIRRFPSEASGSEKAILQNEAESPARR